MFGRVRDLESKIPFGWGTKLTADRSRKKSALSIHTRAKHALLGGVWTLGLVCALTAGSAPAAMAQYYYYPYGYPPEFRHPSRHHPKVKPAAKVKETDHISKDPFGNIPSGPLQIFISIDQQRLHLYSDGVQVADTTIATGVPQHPTPMGVFSVIQKDRFHHSNIYSNAPMPFMQRITWSGVALHEGVNLGHPASHGCIRMPHEFAARLWVLTKLGVRVVVTRPELKPAVIQDAHLFVHKDLPQVSSGSIPDPVKTAQTVDNNKATDVVDPSMAAAPNPGVPAADATHPNSAKPDAALIDPTKSVAAGVDADDASVPVADPSATSPVASAPVDVHSETAQPLAADAKASAPPAAAGGEQAAGSTPDPIVQPDIAIPENVPVPLPKPAALAKATAGAPISIFISRKTKKIYVRQHFSALFDAPITIDQPEQPLGTHVFTAMDYLDDHSTFRWNVVSLPNEPPRPSRKLEYEKRFEKSAKRRRREDIVAAPVADPAPPQTPAEVLARIEIPQDVIDQISELIVPGSSLVVSDQGLGGETGDGTDFIVITH